MILNEAHGEFENTLNAETVEFEIENSAKLFDILSNKIYEDVPRAIIRELSCNAIDANIDAGDSGPIKVYFPTAQNPSLIIEDQGVGMTHEDIMTVYRSYGKSTKSNSNKVIGALGLGGKTPLAYTQQFTIETSKDGKKNSYIIFKDDNGIPNVSLVKTEDCSLTGTSVEMLIKPEDFDKFYRAAIKTFAFFDKMPIIIRGEEKFYDIFKLTFLRSYKETSVKGIYEDVRNKLKKDIINYEIGDQVTKAITTILADYNADCGIVMGQIFYTVNSKLLLDHDRFGNDADFFFHFPVVKNLSTAAYKVIHVDLGSVAIQPSREALNYNKDTIAFLRNKFYEYFDNWSKNLIQNYSDPKKLLKKFNNIENIDKLKLVREKRIHGSTNESVIFLGEIANDLIGEMFRPVVYKNPSNFLFYVNRTYRSYETINLLGKAKSHSNPQDDTEICRTFEHIVYGKKVSVFVIDQDKVVSKIRNLNTKAITNNRYKFTCPIVIRNRMSQNNIENAILIDENTFKKLPCLKNFTTVYKYTEIMPIRDVSAPKATRKKIDTSGKCFSDRLNRFVDFAEMEKQAQKENVYYEFFEGEIYKKGWFYAPKAALIANGSVKSKTECIDILRKGSWESKKDFYIQAEDAAKKLGIRIPEIKNYYFIDWNFYKKNDIINQKNFIYINDHIFKQIGMRLPEFDKLETQGHTYSKVICQEQVAKNLLNLGGSFYKKFDQTVFGIEMNRIIQERSQPEVNYSSIAASINTIIRVLNEKCFIKKDYDTENHKKTIDHVLRRLNNLVLSIENKYRQNAMNQVDNIIPIIEKYPMLFFVNFKGYDFTGGPSPNATKFVIDYIATIEGLTP